MMTPKINLWAITLCYWNDDSGGGTWQNSVGKNISFNIYVRNNIFIFDYQFEIYVVSQHVSYIL
jgi:hypothetical protein